MRMGLRLACAAVVLAAVAGMSGASWARPIGPETVTGVAKKADMLATGVVTKIETVGEEQSDTWKMTLERKRATIRVVRGMRTTDASAVGASVATVEYLAVKPGAAVPEGPQFPVLREGEVAVFPLKKGEGKAWQFVSEEDFGMIAPAAEREIGVGWPANMEGPAAYLCREVAGAFLYGDFSTMARAGRYLDALGAEKLQPVDVLFGLMKAEIGDNLLREDSRWLAMGVASYVASGVPRPTFDALVSGRVASGRGVNGGGDDLPERASLRMAALNLRKATRQQQGERILMMLVNHQEDPEVAWGIATALADNYAGTTMMQQMERAEFKTGKPGALFVADYLVKGPESPLAAAAGAGAAKALEVNGSAHDAPAGQPYSQTLRRAEGLILRAGSEDDFAALTEAIRSAKVDNAKEYEALLLLAGDGELSMPQRVLKICALYIEDTTAMTTGPWAGARLCDMAAMTAARVGKQDFGINPQDPEEKRDAAVAKAGAWLKKIK